MTQHTVPFAAVLGLLGFSMALAGCAFSVDDGPGVDGAGGPAEKPIVGGSTTTIAQHPWQISLQTPDGFHFCGGSILSASFVLTAQHCMEGATPSSLRVVAGATSLSDAGSQGQTRSVDHIIEYPGFTSPEHGHDVTLLHLSSPLVLGPGVQPIDLATPDDEAAGADAAGVTANVSGWGTLSSGAQSTPDTLHAVNVKIIGLDVAQQDYSQESLTADQLAAGAPGKDSCQGDSGGPLTVSSSRGTLLAGVVSWGYGCADPNYPGLYARVASFSSWIAQNAELSTPPPATDPGGDPTPPPPAPSSSTLLSKQDLSGAQGSFHHFAVTVPAGATTLTVTFHEDAGDGDLYVRQGRKPTLGKFDCRPWTAGEDETCTLPSPAPGTWYVSVQGYSAYSGGTLVATVE